MSHALPPFAEARARLEAELQARGWPARVRWIRRADILAIAPEPVIELHLDRSDDDFRAAYDQIAARDGAVKLFALCTIVGPESNEESCAAVAAFPPDERPAPGGLVVAVAETKVAGAVRWPHC